MSHRTDILELMAWAYTVVNKIFDRKKQDLNF